MKNIISLTMIALAVMASGAVSAKEAILKIPSIAERNGVEIVEITKDNSYIIGIEDGDEISSAVLASGISDGGGKACIVAFNDVKSAKMMYERLWKNYEFPACDSDDKMVFVKYGTIVAYFKGKAGEIEAHVRSFTSTFGIESMKIIKNRAKSG